jgi:hypothetical protein
MKLAVDERSCIRARRALSLALDDEAAAADVLEAAVHIGHCEPCSRFAAHVVAFTRALRSGRLERAGAPGAIDHSKGGKS